MSDCQAGTDNKLLAELENPQPKHTVRIARIIWDAINCAKFSKYEQNALKLIHRLSYGCKGHKTCQLKSWSDFECVGIHKTMIKKVLKGLVRKRIVVLNWRHKIIAFNKHIVTWKVEVNPGWNSERMAMLIALNVQRDENDKVSKKLTFALREVSKKLTFGKSEVSKKLTACYENTNFPKKDVSKNLTTPSERASHSAGLQDDPLDTVLKDTKDTTDQGVVDFVLFLKEKFNLASDPPPSRISDMVHEYGLPACVNAAESSSPNSRTWKGILNYVETVANGISAESRGVSGKKLDDMEEEYKHLIQDLETCRKEAEAGHEVNPDYVQQQTEKASKLRDTILEYGGNAVEWR